MCKPVRSAWLTYKRSQSSHLLLSECDWGAAVGPVRYPDTYMVDKSHLPQEFLPGWDICNTLSKYLRKSAKAAQMQSIPGRPCFIKVQFLGIMP